MPRPTTGRLSLFIDEGKLIHTYSMMGVFVLASIRTSHCPRGSATQWMDFSCRFRAADTGGVVKLFANGPAGEKAGWITRSPFAFGLRRHGHRP